MLLSPRLIYGETTQMFQGQYSRQTNDIPYHNAYRLSSWADLQVYSLFPLYIFFALLVVIASARRFCGAWFLPKGMHHRRCSTARCSTARCPSRSLIRASSAAGGGCRVASAAVRAAISNGSQTGIAEAVN